MAKKYWLGTAPSNRKVNENQAEPIIIKESIITKKIILDSLYDLIFWGNDIVGNRDYNQSPLRV